VEDLNGLVGGGLLHQHLLETAFQRSVLLDAVAVFVQRGGTDAFDFPPCQGRFQQVGGIHRAGGVAGTHDVVDLVDEKDDIGVVLQLVDDGADALFELPAILRAGYHGAHVERDDALVVEHARDVVRHNAHGQSFDDGRLADAGLADEHGVVLLTAAEDLCQALNLLFAADDRVELPFGSRCRHVDAEVVQHGGVVVALDLGGLLGRRCLAWGTAVGAGREEEVFLVVFVVVVIVVGTSVAQTGAQVYLVAQTIVGDAHGRQGPVGLCTLLLQQGQQEVLGVGHVLVAQAGFQLGYFHNLAGCKVE